MHRTVGWKKPEKMQVPKSSPPLDGTRGAMGASSRPRDHTSCLVLVCGHPASGKSRAAADIASRVAAAVPDAPAPVVVSEDSLHIARNAGYAHGHAEKNTRASLKSTVDRLLRKDGPVVIVDSGCGIKGFRYELWCIARAAGARHCVVHVDAPIDDARRWNASRRRSDDDDDEKEWGGYDARIFEDLVVRFERPDGKNRWDAPLFTLRPPTATTTTTTNSTPALDDECGEYKDATREETLTAAVAAITGRGIGGGGGDGASGGGGGGDKILAPCRATQPGGASALSDANLRAEMDLGVQEVVDVIVRAESARGGGGGRAEYAFGEGLPALRVAAAPSLQQLRRMKRTFLKLVGGGVARTNVARLVAKKMFIEYVAQSAEGSRE
jgi:protein KTI12